jgi:hypothetical protein
LVPWKILNVDAPQKLTISSGDTVFVILLNRIILKEEIAEEIWKIFLFVYFRPSPVSPLVLVRLVVSHQITVLNL